MAKLQGNDMESNMNREEANSFARKTEALCYYVQNGVSLGYCAEIDEEEFLEELNNA